MDLGRSLVSGNLAIRRSSLQYVELARGRRTFDCLDHARFSTRSGNDITNRPSAPLAIRAFATAAGGIRVEWAYNTINPSPIPTGFHVYQGTGGTPSYGSPVATVPFASAIAVTFVANLAGGVNGTTYTIGVRAYNATAEEPNTNTVNVTALSVGPTAVIDLTATVIV